ncbi:MAG TPA: hypothetical protein VFH51_02520, partial [Myxococcota bacterium]|nr:hypothetical protein [Myxococcota bacterium]
GRVYLALTGARTRFYRTITEAQQARVDSMQGLHAAIDDATFVMRERENTAWSEVSRFFAAHPGEEIVLVMGAVHEMAKHCGQNGCDPELWFNDLSAVPAHALAASRQALHAQVDVCATLPQ